MSAREGWIENFETLDSRGFAIEVRKLADSLSYGIDHSPFRGSGTEYVQSRPYQEGDSVRAIDWYVTARTGKFHVKEYEAQKSIPCWLLIDTSASMTISSRKPSKYELALFIAGGLALAALDRVSPVGVIGVGERALRVRPSMSSARVMQWIFELRRHRYDERTTLGARIQEMSPSLKERALVVILSDLFDDLALQSIKRLAHRHDCVVLQFEDPSEMGLRGSGFFRAREAETGREFVTRGNRAWIDPERAAKDLMRAGVDHLRIRTDQECAPALRHLFRGRGSIARGAR